MAEYPDWVLRYKSKGMYVKKSKSGYSLYRGHSERVPGKKYPIFKCDEYMGIITERDGLVKSSPSVKPDVKVLRYGLFKMVEHVCSILRKPLWARGLDANLIYSHSLLSLEGEDSVWSYSCSWLSERYPGLDMCRTLSEEEKLSLERMKKQMYSKLQSGYGSDLLELMRMSSNVYAVHVNEKWVLSNVSEELFSKAAKYDLIFLMNTDKQ